MISPMSSKVGLARDLNWLGVLAMGLASEVGAGIFYVSAQVQGIVPGIGPRVPLAMLVDGGLALILVAVYWFFSYSLAGAGGEYLFVSRTMGARTGFIIHVISWFGATASVGFLAYAAPSFFSSALAHAMPGLSTWISSPTGGIVTGTMLIWVAWAIHARGIRWVGLFLKIAMGIILIAAATVIAVALTHTPAQLEQALVAKTHLSAATILAHRGPAPSWKAFFEALPVLYFAYSGLRSATYTGGETPNAKRVVGRTLVGLLALVAALYISFSWALYRMAPWPIVAGLIGLGDKSLANASALTGLFLPPSLAVALNLAVAVIVFKTILPAMMGQSRMLVAFAADGLIPEKIGQLSRYRTPVIALTAGAVLANIVLVETVLTGTAFGLASSVLAGTLVHAALGVGMTIMPRTAPALYEANSTWLRRYRGLQWAVGLSLVGIALALAYLVVLPHLATVWYFNPVFQVGLFALIGAALYQRYWNRVVKDGAVDAHRTRFASESTL